MARTLVKTIAGTPIGAIEAFGGDVIPEGWALCDGSTLSRTEYADLFAIIGTAHGHGAESSPGVSDGTSFHLPDLRGRFLRGTDNGAGRDGDAGARTAANAGGNIGDAVGTVQNDEFASHNHGGGSHGHSLRYRSSVEGNRTFGGAAGFADRVERTNDEYMYSSYNASNGNLVNGSGTIISTQGGNENRPINANVNYIIKIE